MDKDTCIKWNYAGGDEFNGTAIDEAMWQTRFPLSRALISEDIYYSEKNVIVDSGVVKFRVNKEKARTKIHIWEHDSAVFKRERKYPDSEGIYEMNYTGGLIWSRKKYKYGYFEVRFKNPENTGLWPAFWLYGEKTNEIDFMELKGEKNDHIHVDIHCPDGCNNYIQGLLNYRKSFGHWIKTDGNLSDQFNVVSGEWQPGYVKYYLNGNLIAYFAGNIDVDMALTAGNGKAHEGGPFAPGVGDKTIFPSDFTVDYIRVWTKADSSDLQKLRGRDFQIVNEPVKTIIQPRREKIKFRRKMNQKPGEKITLSVLPLNTLDYTFSLSGYSRSSSGFRFQLLNKEGVTLFEPANYSNGYYNTMLAAPGDEIYLKLKYDAKEYVVRIK